MDNLIVFSYSHNHREYVQYFEDEQEASKYFKSCIKTFPNAGFILAKKFDSTGYRVLSSKDKNVPVLKLLKDVPSSILSIFRKNKGEQFDNTLNDI